MDGWKISISWYVGFREGTCYSKCFQFHPSRKWSCSIGLASAGDSFGIGLSVSGVREGTLKGVVLEEYWNNKNTKSIKKYIYIYINQKQIYPKNIHVYVVYLCSHGINTCVRWCNSNLLGWKKRHIILPAASRVFVPGGGPSASGENLSS